MCLVVKTIVFVIIFQLIGYGSNRFCNIQNPVDTHIYTIQFQYPLKFFVNFVCYKTNTDVGFYPFGGKMENRPHFERSLGDPICPFDWPQATLLFITSLSENQVLVRHTLRPSHCSSCLVLFCFGL